MKAKIIREDMEVSPSFKGDGTIVREVTRNGKPTSVRFWPMGHILESPDCYRLVQRGVAVPDDDECEKAAGMTKEQMAYAQARYEMVARGIHPDDYERFEKGIIQGYKDNKDIPGENAWMEEESEEE